MEEAMLTVKGKLPIGVERDGVFHRDFEMRPRLVRDTRDVVIEHGMKKLDDDIFFSMAMTARQIIRIGEISPVSADDLLDLVDRDMTAINNAKDDLASRLDSFHEPEDGESGAGNVSETADTSSSETDSIAAQDQDALGGGAGDDHVGGAGVS
jgi:phage FluMu protein gp41